MMSKYVNADELTQVLQGIRVSGAKVLDFNDALDWVCDVIGELPFIEIVRCNECKYYYDWCDDFIDNNGYCSFGEKGETDA